MKRFSKNAQALSNGVTIKEVAIKAGVSTATVSRVLSGVNPVREGARQKVLKAIKNLDYTPNRLAQGLRAGRQKVIGVIIPDLQNPFFTSLVRGVEATLYREGYALLLGHSDGLAAREQTHLAVLRGEGVAGLIIIPCNEADADYNALALWQIPAVAVDRVPNGWNVDLVCTNNRESAKEAVNHLLSHGYKDIGFINGPRGLNVTAERMAGYQDALQASGIRLQDSMIIHSDFRQAGGMEAMAYFLDQPQPPRAMLVANNLMTLGALQVIHERKIRIPDDLALISFDDMPWAVSLHPPLTALAQPAEELGRTSAELLLERIKDPQRPPRHIVVPSRLVVRASCGIHQSSPEPKHNGQRS